MATCSVDTSDRTIVNAILSALMSLLLNTASMRRLAACRSSLQQYCVPGASGEMSTTYSS